MRGLILLLGLLVMDAQATDLYRSVDSHGKVHYSDKPLPGTQDVEELKVDKAPEPDNSLSYEAQRAKQNFPVTLYVLSTPGTASTQARALLNKRGIPFVEKQLSNLEDFEAFRKASGGEEVPALSVGKTWLKGFLVEQWNKELDFAGYPKIAPYRGPSATPVSQPAQ